MLIAVLHHLAPIAIGEIILVSRGEKESILVQCTVSASFEVFLSLLNPLPIIRLEPIDLAT